MERGEDDDEPADEVETPPADQKMENIKKARALKAVVKTPSTAESLNDEDAKCYAARYNDIPKTHYSTVGIEQGRLGTCAKKLTNQQA
jgi:hypothetical protein